MTLPLSAVVINFQTPDLLQTAVRSFCQAYPHVPVLVLDNGSQDESPDLVAQLESEHAGQVTSLLLAENIFHGPAMHRALQAVETPYVYVFDSDTKTQRGGFLEPMAAWLQASEKHYGAGHVVTVNRRGFAAPTGIPVLASAYMLLKRAVYFQLPPFVHHGLPALQNFKAAAAQGYQVSNVPIQDYVEHLGRGTADRFGYGLGMRSRLDYLFHKLGL